MEPNISFCLINGKFHYFLECFVVFPAQLKKFECVVYFLKHWIQVLNAYFSTRTQSTWILKFVSIRLTMSWVLTFLLARGQTSLSILISSHKDWSNLWCLFWFCKGLKPIWLLGCVSARMEVVLIAYFDFAKDWNQFDCLHVFMQGLRKF